MRGASKISRFLKCLDEALSQLARLRGAYLGVEKYTEEVANPFKKMNNYTLFRNHFKYYFHIGTNVFSGREIYGKISLQICEN